MQKVDYGPRALFVDLFGSAHDLFVGRYSIEKERLWSTAAFAS